MSLIRSLTWTKEKPTVNGWYWYRSQAYGKVIGKVYNGRVHWNRDSSRIARLVGEWAGPIREPRGSV